MGGRGEEGVRGWGLKEVGLTGDGGIYDGEVISMLAVFGQ